MHSIIPYIIVVISAVISSADVSIDLKKCQEQVIAKCQCGSGGVLTDVYVDGCQIVSNESQPCQPCPGSCQVFLNCKTCSKHDCLSCPNEKIGSNCDEDEIPSFPNETVIETTQDDLIQNISESSHSETTIPEVTMPNLDGILPKIIISDVSQTNSSSIEPVVESNIPKMVLDLVEFDTENTTIVKLIPEEKSFKNVSINDNENIIDLSEICTSNCSNNAYKIANNSVMDDDRGDILNNAFELGYDKIVNESSQSMNASSEGREIAYESEPLIGSEYDDVRQLKYSRVNIPINISNYLEGDYVSDNESDANEQLLKHRSPNPSDAEDDTLVASPYETHDNKNVQYEKDQQVLDDFPEKPIVSDTQETIEDITNSTGPNLKRSLIESQNNTRLETKYVDLSTYDFINDENEYKYPDIVQEESFPVEQDPVASIKFNETDDLQKVQSIPGQKYDISNPYLLKQYFESREEESPKSKIKVPDSLTNLKAFFPCLSNPSTTDDRKTLHTRHEPHAHMEHTIGRFRSPDYPENKFVFSNSNDAAKDVPFDLKLRSMTNSDGAQHKSDNFLESRGHRIHKPIPKSFNIYNQPTSPPRIYHFNQGYPISQIPVPPIDNNFAMNFQKDLFPSIFEHLLQLIEPHIPPYQDRSFSDEKRKYSSMLPISMYQPSNAFPQTPGQAPEPRHLFGDYNFQSLGNVNPFRPFNFQDTNSISLDHRRIPVVKGQVIIANIANEKNGTASRIVPGSIRSQNFEFDIPMMGPPSLRYPNYPSVDDSLNSITEHPKHTKGSRRPKKLHKRRRNGVKGDTASAAKKCNPWKEDCTKIASHTNFSGRKTKTLRMDEDTPVQVLTKFIKISNGPKDYSTELTSTSKFNELDDNTAHSMVNESAIPTQEENLENQMRKPDEILQTNYESNSDSGSYQPRFRGRRSTKTHFCPIPQDNRNGDLDCTIWTFKKKCKLTCHYGYTSPHQHFTCSRSTNNWLPPLAACKGGPEFEPEDNSIQLKHLEDLPEDLADEDEEWNNNHDHEEASDEDYGDKHGNEPVGDNQETVGEKLGETLSHEEVKDHEKAVYHEESAVHDEVLNNEEVASSEEFSDHEGSADHEEDGIHEEADVKATTVNKPLPKKPFPKKPFPKKHVAKKTKEAKKAHVNNVKAHEDSHEETEHVHKGQKSHAKSEKLEQKKDKKPELEEGLLKKEKKGDLPKKTEEEHQEEDVILKTSEDSEEKPIEKHAEEDAPKEEAAVSIEHQEIGQNDAYDYDETYRKK